MTTYRVRYGKDATGRDAWVLDESGARIEAFVTKKEALSRASSVAQKEAAKTRSPVTLVVETKDGREQRRKEVQEGETTGFGENLFGL
jgi:hypothetical protein